MSDIQVSVRHVFGPSLEADETVSILSTGGWGLPGPMDDRWIARWRALCAAIGLVEEVDPAGADPAGAGPGRLAALATERLVAAAAGRPPVAVRPGAGSDAGEHVISFMPRPVAMAAARIGVATVDLTRHGMPPDAAVQRMASAAARLKAVVEDHPVGSSRPVSLVLVDACRRLGVPWRWSTAYPGTTLVGEGRRQTRFDGCSPLGSPVLGGMLAANKLGGKRFLATFGLPILPDRVVTRAEEAVPAAEAIGYPVVVKPIDASRGRGLTLDVRTPDEAHAAFLRARPEGSAVMLEPYLAIPDFRAVVIGDRVTMVFRRNPPYVTGDGRSTVAALLGEHNLAVREQRQAFPSKYEVTVDGDLEATLARSGLSLASVPDAGRQVTLRTIPLRAYGGYPVDVTAETHPANQALFRRLMALSGLPVAAIDFRAETVERPWDQQRFAILEYNARPDLGNFGGHPTVDAIVRQAAPDAEAVRLPTIVIVDPAPGEAPAALRQAIDRRGLAAAVAGPDGLRLGSYPVRINGGEAHDRMAEDPTLEVAVHWTTPERITRHGLGVALVDIAFLPGGEPSDADPRVVQLVRQRSRSCRPLPAGDVQARAAIVLEAIETLAAGQSVNRP